MCVCTVLAGRRSTACTVPAAKLAAAARDGSPEKASADEALVDMLSNVEEVEEVEEEGKAFWLGVEKNSCVQEARFACARPKRWAGADERRKPR